MRLRIWSAKCGVAGPARARISSTVTRRPAGQPVGSLGLAHGLSLLVALTAFPARAPAFRAAGPVGPRGRTLSGRPRRDRRPATGSRPRSRPRRRSPRRGCRPRGSDRPRSPGLTSSRYPRNAAGTWAAIVGDQQRSPGAAGGQWRGGGRVQRPRGVRDHEPVARVVDVPAEASARIAGEGDRVLNRICRRGADPPRARGDASAPPRAPCRRSPKAGRARTPGRPGGGGARRASAWAPPAS